MADMELAIRKTLIHEGGFVDDPDDPGGATKYGITQKDLPGVDISALTEQQAIDYYKQHYVKTLYAQIESQAIGEKIFDLGVLDGVGSIIHVLQAVLKPSFPDVEIDGNFGPVTLSAVNQSDEASLLQAYKNALVARVFQIIAANPAEKKFAAGWIRRINS
jgi:lysozyme family protein